MTTRDTPGEESDGGAPSLVTWAALLAHWTRFAQSAVALPRDGEGARWRQCVPDVIALHAVTLACAGLDDLPEGERALGLDRAGLMVRRHAGNIHEAWRGEPLPEGLQALENEAFEAVRRAPDSGIEWIAGAGGGEGHAPDPAWTRALSGRAVVFALRSGERVLTGTPVLFARGLRGGPPAPDIAEVLGAWAARMGAGDGPSRVPVMRQVYRRGGAEVVAMLDDTLPAGMPLLMECRGE